MKIKISLICFFTAVCLAVPGRAQNTVLEGYIQLGLKSNLQLRQEQLNYERSIESLNQAKALFMPYVQLNGTYQFANGGRQITLPIGDLLNPVYQKLGYPSINNTAINFLANNFHDSKVRVIQPLFNPEIYFNYKAQKELISVQQAQKMAYENQLKYEITSAYYQYLQSDEALRILVNTRELQRQLLKVNQRLVAEAKATKDVVLSTEYELEKTEQLIAENEKNFDVAQAYFNFLVNRDLRAPIEKDSTLSLSIQSPAEVSALTAQALQQRQELKQLQNGLRAGEQVIDLNRGNALLPKVNVVGDVGYQGYYYTFSNQQYWLVQFGLTWDLFKGGEKRSRTQQARIDYQVMENKMEQLKRQIELQVIQAYDELKAAQQAYSASVSGIKSAERVFQIIRAKYQEGQAILLEYIDAQNNYTTAQLTLSINQYEVLRKAASLQKTISNL